MVVASTQPNKAKWQAAFGAVYFDIGGVTGDRTALHFRQPTDGYVGTEVHVFADNHVAEPRN